MKRCLQLAALGAGHVSPNPMVGAVLVHNDRIIGEGYHRQYGKAHAEVNCINSVAETDSELIAQSSLYVSLEPCAHFGKTPPCADLILQHKIPTVVIGCRDSFAKVNGLGIQKLKDAGVTVIESVLEKEALELNKFFFCFHEKKRPYIILKWAATADGFIAKENYEAVKISNNLSNRLVHQLRAHTDAIMVGTNTALHDNPSLTTRLWPGKDSVKVFIDKKLQVGSDSLLFNDNASVIVLNEIKEEESNHIHYIKINKEEDILLRLMNVLAEKNINSLLVEGGSRLLHSFIDAGLWDEAYTITNTTMFLNKGIQSINMPSENLRNQFSLSTDIIHHYKNVC